MLNQNNGKVPTMPVPNFEAMPQPTNHDVYQGDINGQEFLVQGNEQLGHILIGEREAKLGLMVAMVSGLNVVYFGQPGAGKTNLLHYGHRLISDLDEHSIKFIPPQSDLTGKEMSGGTVTSTKRIVADGTAREEQNSTTIEPILHEDVRVLIGDEVNRANPLAIGAALEALESHRVVNNMGERDLLKLQYAAFAFNPRGIDRTVFQMSPALISRLPIGVHMGSNPSDEDAILSAAFDRQLTRPEAMRSITNFDQIQSLRSKANKLIVPEDIRTRSKLLISEARNTLKDLNISEGIGRQAHQIVRVAASLAILGGNNRITMGDMLQATKFGVVSRVGASEVSADPHVVYEEILNKARIHDQERQTWYVSQNHATK